jgi:hypothetical protein
LVLFTTEVFWKRRDFNEFNNLEDKDFSHAEEEAFHQYMSYVHVPRLLFVPGKLREKFACLRLVTVCCVSDAAPPGAHECREWDDRECQLPLVSPGEAIGCGHPGQGGVPYLTFHSMKVRLSCQSQIVTNLASDNSGN